MDGTHRQSSGRRRKPNAPSLPLRRRSALFPAALIAALGVVVPPLTEAQPSEREILVELHDACGGDFWVDSKNWNNESASVCDWYGISCTDEEEVEAVELVGNNLSCTLPASIFRLPQIRTIDLGQNPNLDVAFPDLSEDGRAERLMYLRLNLAGITSIDGISRTVGSNLLSLDVASNDIEGPFPLEVLSFPALRGLDLSYNFYSGELPPDMGSLSDMHGFLLSNNFFEGAIPPSMGNFTQVDTVDLSENGFSGPLPGGMNRWTSVAMLSLRNQNPPGAEKDVKSGIEGSVLPFPDSPLLFWLDLSGNALAGPVPDDLLESRDPDSYQTTVDLADNILTGLVPVSLARFLALRIHLSDNQITGIAAELCDRQDWFFGQVEEFGCDAILCPPATYNAHGRQIKSDLPCLSCPGGEADAPFFGSTGCTSPEETGASQVASSSAVDSTAVANSDLSEGPGVFVPRGSGVGRREHKHAKKDVGRWGRKREPPQVSGRSSVSAPEGDGFGDPGFPFLGDLEIVKSPTLEAQVSSHQEPHDLSSLDVDSDVEPEQGKVPLATSQSASSGAARRSDSWQPLRFAWAPVMASWLFTICQF